MNGATRINLVNCTPGTEAVHIDDIALELNRRRPRDGKFGVAVRRAGQDRVQQHLDALRRQLARGFREPHVIANRQTETAHVRHVEDTEFSACRDTGLIGPEREHLCIAADDLALRIDHHGRVIDPAVFGIGDEHRAGDQPDTMLDRSRLKLLKRFVLGRQGILVQRTVGGQLGKQNHLRPYQYLLHYYHHY